MKQSLQIKLHQQLSMTPQLQQAIRLLQLSSMELEQEINKILETNPLLENDDTGETSEGESAADDSIEADPALKLEMDNSSEIENHWDLITELSIQQQKMGHDFDNSPELWQQKATELTLHKHLLWQLEVAHLSDEEHAIGWAIIDSISEDGYLSCTLDEIAQSTGLQVNIQDIERVLLKIQQFDPIGVGARSLGECLNLQLQALPLNTAWLLEAKQIVLHHLDLLGKRDFPRLKQILKISQNNLEAVIKILTSLDPKPGIKIASKRLEYIIPDVIVRKKNKHYCVELNKEFIPRLRINPQYETLIQHANTNRHVILKDQLKEAKWFIKSLKSRQETLLTVAKHIIQMQKHFLENGEEYMKPLALQDVANSVGLHESTISRITTQKYVLTPRGVFELKYFFSNTLSNKLPSAHRTEQEDPLNTSGNAISATAVRAIIKKWIQQEPNSKPLSDQQIVEKLNAKHIHIARRTVAKYREALRIPASHERKACQIQKE